MPLTPPALQRLALPLAAACALAACAQLPELGELPRPKTPDALQASAALAAPAADWPAEAWWRAYGDAQLDALIDEALAGSPDLAAAAARLSKAEAGVLGAGSALKPQVSAGASVTGDKLSYNYLFPRTPQTEGFNDYGRATVDLRWELDFWGRNRAALAAATSELDAQRAELAQARLLLTSALASAYAELNRLGANRATALRSLELRRKTAALFDERLRNGLENRGSWRQADARRAAAEGALLEVDERIALQRHRIAALLGAGPDRGLKVELPTQPPARAFGLPAELPLELLGRRPDIVAARLQVQAQASRVEQRKADFYPNVNLSAFVGVQALGLDMLTQGGSNIASVGPAISLPLFDGGRLQGELRGARARHAEAVANYDATLARALQEVADAAVSQQSLTQQLVKAQEAVDAAIEAHRVVSNRYQGGIASYLEVLAIEDQLLASLDALTNLRSRSFTLDIALKRALGGGWSVAPAPTKP